MDEIDHTQELPSHEKNPVTGRWERVVIYKPERLAKGDIHPYADTDLHLKGLRSFEWPPYALKVEKILYHQHIETALEISSKRDAAVRRHGAGSNNIRRAEIGNNHEIMRADDAYFALIGGIWGVQGCIVTPLMAKHWMRIKLVCFQIDGLKMLRKWYEAIKKDQKNMREAFDSAQQKLYEIEDFREKQKSGQNKNGRNCTL